MYLVDTNIWLERLLGQEKSEEVGDFLDLVPPEQLFVTDFALHSIGVILTRLGAKKDYLNFIEDLFIVGDVSEIGLEASDMPDLVSVMDAFRLDFDDAYQYIAARNSDFTIISFDKDFDKTALGRKQPAEIIEEKQKKTGK